MAQVDAAHSRRMRLASLGIVCGGAFWGLFWLPVRSIGEIGLTGAWPGAVIYAGAVAVLLPAIVWRRRQLWASWRGLAVCGLLTGTAFSFYSTGLVLSDVVRVILLFYLTPVWGTLLGVAVLGEKLTLSRVCALILGIAGLMVVLGAGQQFPWPRNLGDWLALGAGIVWAYGSLKLYQMGDVAVHEQIIAFIAGSLIVTLATILVGGAAFGETPGLSAMTTAATWGLVCAFYVLPMMYLTIWPATLLTPGRVGLLLMSEVIVGVASAAALSGEPFGLREMLGTVLIVGAAFVEVLGHKGQPGG